MLVHAIPPANLAKVFGIPTVEIQATVAVRGEGVFEVFNAITTEVLKAFFEEINCRA